MTPKVTTLLKYRRPARSVTEETFISKYLDIIPGMFADAYGNRILMCKESKTIISTHTDTVHILPGSQSPHVKKGIISLSKLDLLRKSNCLGADDSAGIYAALRMIDAGVKTTFIFHRDEEIGGRGSSWLAKNYADWLRTFDHCIALDRRGTQDVITRQAWSRCCSNDFATALCDALSMGHKPSDEGIFTDSANYIGIIPECTNISVGYYNEHTANETLDTRYLEALIEKLISIDYSILPVVAWKDDFAFNPYEGTYQNDIDLDYFGKCEYCSKPQTALRETEEYLLACDECYQTFA